MMKTGEVLATLLSEKRNSEAMLTVFKMAVEEAGFYPKFISTDKCHIYDALRKYRKIKHIHAHFETKFIPYNNTILPVSQNRIERYHSEIRPKEVRMRGIKNFQNGTRFFQLRGVIHNYLRTHLSLGMTPAAYSGVSTPISWNTLATTLEICAHTI
jgi:transposase-like protein